MAAHDERTDLWTWEEVCRQSPVVGALDAAYQDGSHPTRVAMLEECVSLLAQYNRRLKEILAANNIDMGESHFHPAKGEKRDVSKPGAD